MPANDILGLLQGIEDRCRRFSKGLPQQIDERPTWEGVVFLMSDTSYIVAVDQVQEVLNYPASVTRVPGTQNWMTGVANIRGDLLPVVDLQEFIGGGTTIIGRRSRVLVMAHEGARVGLTIQDVIGLRTFYEHQRGESTTVDSRMGIYISGAFDNDEMHLNIFNTDLLGADNRFQSAAQ